MSRDCEYLFVWESNSRHDLDAGKTEAAISEASEWPADRVVWLDQGRLYWRCVKHGLDYNMIQFPVRPDQILESADGECFEDVKPIPKIVANAELQEAFGLALALLSRPEPASDAEKQIMASALRGVMARNGVLTLDTAQNL